MKNSAVGSVQAIQAITPAPARSRARGAAHEPDHGQAGHDGQHPGGRIARPQSRPEALTVRVITTTMGFASLPVSVRASSSSTQLNMKQKNTRDADPARGSRGRKMPEEEVAERCARPGGPSRRAPSAPPT